MNVGWTLGVRDREPVESNAGGVPMQGQGQISNGFTVSGDARGRITITSAARQNNATFANKTVNVNADDGYDMSVKSGVVGEERKNIASKTTASSNVATSNAANGGKKKHSFTCSLDLTIPCIAGCVIAGIAYAASSSPFAFLTIPATVIVFVGGKYALGMCAESFQDNQKSYDVKHS